MGHSMNNKWSLGILGIIGVICAVAIYSTKMRLTSIESRVSELLSQQPEPETKNHPAPPAHKIIKPGKFVRKTKSGSFIPKNKGWGNIKAKLVVRGSIPDEEKLIGGTEGKAGTENPASFIASDEVLVSEEGGLKNAILFLYADPEEPQEPQYHTSRLNEISEQLTLTSDGKRFDPRVIAIRPFDRILFDNQDSNLNRLQINSSANPIGKVALGNESIELSNRDFLPEKIPVSISNDDYPWMKGVFFVRDEPYFALSSDDGSIEIRNMPTGDWHFQLWHERTGLLTGLKDHEGNEVLHGDPAIVTISVRADQTTDLGTLEIDAHEFEAK